MTKAERIKQLVTEYKTSLIHQGNLRTVRRKILKIAGQFKKAELIEIWEQHLKEPTELYYKNDEDAYDVDQFRRTVWKRRTQKAKDNLLEKAKDFERRAYKKSEKAKQTARLSSNVDDFIEVERSNTSTDVIAIHKPLNKDKLLSVYLSALKEVLDNPNMVPEDSDEAYKDAKQMLGI